LGRAAIAAVLLGVVGMASRLGPAWSVAWFAWLALPGAALAAAGVDVYRTLPAIAVFAVAGAASAVAIMVAISVASWAATPELIPILLPILAVSVFVSLVPPMLVAGALWLAITRRLFP
jgi:hypothetical protein